MPEHITVRFKPELNKRKPMNDSELVGHIKKLIELPTEMDMVKYIDNLDCSYSDKRSLIEHLKPFLSSSRVSRETKNKIRELVNAKDENGYPKYAIREISKLLGISYETIYEYSGLSPSDAKARAHAVFRNPKVWGKFGKSKIPNSVINRIAELRDLKPKEIQQKLKEEEITIGYDAILKYLKRIKKN